MLYVFFSFCYFILFDVPMYKSTIRQHFIDSVGVGHKDRVVKVEEGEICLELVDWKM